MKLIPRSSARRSTRLHSSRSAGSPQIPSPVRRMAPKPKRLTGRSPPMSMVPASAALMVVVVRSAMTSSWVVAGWHGMAFDQPLIRMRETIAIVRQVLRRDRLLFEGDVFKLDMGLKLLARPVRETVPIYLATLTAGGLRLTGELADGWIPTLFSPGHMDLFRPDLEAGAKISSRSLDSLAIAPHVPVSIDDDRARAREALKPWVALYVGGMGSRTKNFYNDLVSRYGFADDARTLQDLYLGGKQLEAIRDVPDALVDGISIAGPPAYVPERLAVWASAGVTTLLASVHGKTQPERLRTVEMLAAAGGAVD